VEQLTLFSKAVIRTWPTKTELRAARRHRWEQALARDADAKEATVDTGERIPVAKVGRDDGRRR
jgi:hypothetical protein